MKSLLTRLGLAVLGVGLTLAWWTIHPGKSTTESSDRIPTVVGAGGHKLEIEAESDGAATMRISFSEHDKAIGEQKTLNSWEKFPSGSRSWAIDVPAHVGGYIEVGADHPNVGDRLSLRIRMDGKLIDEQMEKLDSPLQSGTAFFLQAYYEDYSNAAKEAAED